MPRPCGPCHLRLVFRSESTEQAAGPEGSPSLQPQPACPARSGVAPRAIPPHPGDSSRSGSGGNHLPGGGRACSIPPGMQAAAAAGSYHPGRGVKGPVITDEPASHHTAPEACPLPRAHTHTHAQPMPAVRVHVPRAALRRPRGLRRACPRPWAGSLQCPLP